MVDGPVDRKMAFNEGLLEQGEEAKTLWVACACAVHGQGKPFMFGEMGLWEQVMEKLLGHTVDLLCCFWEAEDGSWEPVW